MGVVFVFGNGIWYVLFTESASSAKYAIKIVAPIMARVMSFGFFIRTIAFTARIVISLGDGFGNFGFGEIFAGVLFWPDPVSKFSSERISCSIG